MWRVVSRKDSHGRRLTFPGNRIPRNLWYAPYVMAGLITSTRLAFKPRHRPDMPSSPSMISTAVSKIPFLTPFGCVCCLVVMTLTGIVNTCAMAPATAPRESSAAVPGADGTF